MDFTSNNDDGSLTDDHSDRVLSLPRLVPIRSDAEREAASAPSSDGTVSFAVNQVNYEQLSGEYLGVYAPTTTVSRFTTEVVYDSVRLRFRSAAAADVALIHDALRMWKEGRRITAFSSLTHFLAYSRVDFLAFNDREVIKGQAQKPSRYFWARLD